MKRRLSPKILTLAIAFVVAAGPIGLAAAQGQDAPPGDDDANETGDENAFGALKVPYQVMMNGREILVEARIVVKDMYEDEDATYFMFGVDTQEAPALYADLTSVQTADGEDLKVLEKQGKGTDLEKWFVDVEDMPPAGTEIVMTYTVGSTQKGFYQVGGMLVPFNYRWEQVDMDNGEQAKLYGATQIGVNEETKAGGGMKFRSPGGGEESSLPVPGAGALVALGVLAAAAVAVGARGRNGRRRG